MHDALIQNLKNSWRNINSSTITFAQTVPINQWCIKPFTSRFTSFSWEFSCLVRTRLVYIKGFKTGKLIFSKQKDIPNKDSIEAWDKKMIIHSLMQSSKNILIEIKKINNLNTIDMINWLFQHERIHHGKLILYHAKMNYTLPENFMKTWGKDNFKSIKS